MIGVNGTGKTTLLRHIAFSDVRQKPKHGLCVIDPHGDLIDDIIALDISYEKAWDLGPCVPAIDHRREVDVS